MTDHDLVDWTLDRIAQNYDPLLVPVDRPLLKDDVDGTIYRLETGLQPTGGATVGSESRIDPGDKFTVGSAQVGTATVGTLTDYSVSGSAQVGTATVGTTLGGRTPIDRDLDIDLQRTAAVTVSATPDRDDTPIGTEYDLRVVDGVEVLIEALHADKYGQIEDPDEFKRLKDEIRRAILTDRTNPPSNNLTDTDYHSVVPVSASEPPEASSRDYFAYTFELEFRGFQEL